MLFVHLCLSLVFVNVIELWVVLVLGGLRFAGVRFHEVVARFRFEGSLHPASESCVLQKLDWFAGDDRRAIAIGFGFVSRRAVSLLELLPLPFFVALELFYFLDLQGKLLRPCWTSSKNLGLLFQNLLLLGLLWCYNVMF